MISRSKLASIIYMHGNKIPFFYSVILDGFEGKDEYDWEEYIISKMQEFKAHLVKTIETYLEDPVTYPDLESIYKDLDPIFWHEFEYFNAYENLFACYDEAENPWEVTLRPINWDIYGLKDLFVVIGAWLDLPKAILLPAKA